MRRANRPKLNEDGVAELTIADIKIHMVQDLKKLKKGASPDECEYEAVDVVYECQGVSGPFTIKDRCGTVLNPEPVDEKYRKPVYNKYTTLLLRLGLITEDELKATDDMTDEQFNEFKTPVVERLEASKGVVLKSKLRKVDGYYRVDIGSILMAE